MTGKTADEKPERAVTCLLIGPGALQRRIKVPRSLPPQIVTPDPTAPPPVIGYLDLDPRPVWTEIRTITYSRKSYVWRLPHNAKITLPGGVEHTYRIGPTEFAEVEGIYWSSDQKQPQRTPESSPGSPQ